MSSLLFQGSKFFWRTRNNIDVVIVSLVASKTTEIIAYEPVLDVEAERIYMNSEVLSSLLNRTEIEAKFSFAKQNNVPHTAQFESDVVARASSDFVLNRLVIKELQKEEKRFTVHLHNLSLDAGTNVLMCPKSAELSPYTVKHHKLYSDTEISEAQLALEEAQNNLEEQCNKAIELHSEVRASLSSKECWRIPLVLVKLSKSRPLNETHEKIWRSVSSNLKTQDDIDTLTKTALRIVPAIGTPAHRRNHMPHHTHDNGPTPDRSPCPTPRAAPRTNASSRPNSQRLYSSTVSSQNRGPRNTQEEAPSPRQPPKRARSKGVAAKSSRKDSKRINSKNTPLAATSTDGDAGLFSPERDFTMQTADGAFAEGEARSPLGHRDAGGESLRVFDKCGKASPTNSVGKDFDSTESTPYTSEASVSVASDSAFSRETSYHHTELTVLHEGSARAKQTKRRSYLGSILASFIGATTHEASLQAARREGALDTCSGAEEQEQPAVIALSHKKTAKKRGGGVSLSAALAAWFPWSQSAPVVPVHLPEYIPPELIPQPSN